MRGMQQGMRHGMMQGMMQQRMRLRGMYGSGGMQHGMSGNPADMQQIHTLLANHDTIRRTVRNLPNGVETVTTSSDPRIAALLPEHVRAMYARLKEGRLIRGFDPLFVELFRHGDQIEIQVQPLTDGVRVVESAAEPYAVKLIQAHAQAVSGFVQDGMAAMHRRSPVPGEHPSAHH